MLYFYVSAKIVLGSQRVREVSAKVFARDADRLLVRVAAHIAVRHIRVAA